jgi:hypothetical protein
VCPTSWHAQRCILHYQQPPKLREEEHQEEDANIIFVGLLEKQLEGNTVMEIFYI